MTRKRSEKRTDYTKHNLAAGYLASAPALGILHERMHHMPVH